MADPYLVERFSAFCDAIRAKPSWYHKILDSNRDLAQKWALEAKIVEDTGMSDEVTMALESVPRSQEGWS